MPGNLFERVEASFRAHASRPALYFEGSTLTYAELDDLTARFAGLLRQRGVSTGDRVALMLPNSPAFIAAFQATLKLGAVVVPLNVLLRAPEVAQRFQNSAPRVLVTTAGLSAQLAENAAQLAETTAEHGVDTASVDLLGGATSEHAPVRETAHCDAGDVAVILYTSGTTGHAKGAELTHAGLSWVADGLVRGFGLNEDDVQLGTPPLSHVLGLSGIMNVSLFSGGAIALMQRFDAADAFRLMVETGTTVALGAPTMFIALLAEAAHAEKLPPLRLIHAGGAAMPVETMRELTRTFGIEVREGFGMTETSGTVTTTAPPHEPKLGSCGPAFEDAELRIVSLEGDVLGTGETGELHVRSRGVMRGYRHDPEATAQVLDGDGWFATGDIGYLDDDGYLFLVDRKKELILRGGYNVYPREVEEVLYAYPGVQEATVVGIPDPSLGEEVVALVVAKAGAELNPDAIKAHTREQVAAYKYPRHVLIVDELPKGPTGKIFKRAIDREELMRSLGLEPAQSPGVP